MLVCCVWLEVLLCWFVLCGVVSVLFDVMLGCLWCCLFGVVDFCVIASLVGCVRCGLVWLGLLRLVVVVVLCFVFVVMLCVVVWCWCVVYVVVCGVVVCYVLLCSCFVGGAVLLLLRGVTLRLSFCFGLLCDILYVVFRVRSVALYCLVFLVRVALFVMFLWCSLFSVRSVRLVFVVV